MKMVRIRARQDVRSPDGVIIREGDELETTERWAVDHSKFVEIIGEAKPTGKATRSKKQEGHQI